jgi:hypothetical protein
MTSEEFCRIDQCNSWPHLEGLNFGGKDEARIQAPVKSMNFVTARLGVCRKTAETPPRSFVCSAAHVAPQSDTRRTDRNGAWIPRTDDPVAEARETQPGVGTMFGLKLVTGCCNFKLDRNLFVSRVKFPGENSASKSSKIIAWS